MLFMYVEWRKYLCKWLVVVKKGGSCFSSIGDGTSAVGGREELVNGWEVDGSEVEALLG